MLEGKLSTLLLFAVFYLAGRMHQSWRHTDVKELEFRRGYNSGSRSLFGIAVEFIHRARGTARVNGAVSSTRGSRHSLEDRGAATTRINPGGRQ